MSDEIAGFPPPRRAAPDPADARRAAALRVFARSRGWAVSKSPRRWEQPLAVLRRQLGADHTLIDDVLRWYVGWYAPGRRPAVRDGAELRARWDWLVEIYRRERPAGPLPAAAARAVRLLAELPWPDAAAARLPAAVAQSVRNVESFLARVRETAVPRGLEPLRQHVLALLGDPADYLYGWFKRVFDRYGRWADWSGDLGPWVWCPGHRDFVSAARGWADTWGVGPAAWDRLAGAAG